MLRLNFILSEDLFPNEMLFPDDKRNINGTEHGMLFCYCYISSMLCSFLSLLVICEGM